MIRLITGVSRRFRTNSSLITGKCYAASEIVNINRRNLTTNAMNEIATLTPIDEDEQALTKTIPRHHLPYSLAHLPDDAFVPLDVPQFYANMENLRSGAAFTPSVFYEIFRNRFDNHGVYCNNDLGLQHITHYGFDYDYTLVHYNQALDRYVYDHVLKSLVTRHGYPESVLQLQYDPSFAIRGIVFDKQTGMMLKVDSFGKIQSDSVYFGRERQTLESILATYPGLALPPSALPRCHFFHDLFATPEATLICDLIDSLRAIDGLNFKPAYVQQDVRAVIQELHASRAFHQHVIPRVADYIDPNPRLGAFLERLHASGKKTFLLTNSPYAFVDAGMQYVIGDYVKAKGLSSWRDLFHFICVDARKPHFYSSTASFREVDPNTGVLSLSPSQSLQPGKVYTGGGMNRMMRMCGMQGRNVLYCGDHLTNDLAQPLHEATWRTCAVVKELEDEVMHINDREYQDAIADLQRVDVLISAAQSDHMRNEHVLEMIKTLKDERNKLRAFLRGYCNQYFGSVFRMNNTHSLFFHQLTKTADIYTGSLTNLLNYPVDFTFYAERIRMAHEKPIAFSNMFSPYGAESGGESTQYVSENK